MIEMKIDNEMVNCNLYMDKLWRKNNIRKVVILVVNFFVCLDRLCLRNLRI